MGGFSGAVSAGHFRGISGGEEIHLYLPHNLRRMPVYIDKQKGRPDFFWDNDRLLQPLAAARYQQGRLLGRMESMRTSLRREAFISMLTLEAVRSWELDGEMVPADQVRSSFAARLGWDVVIPAPAGIDAASVAGMILDVHLHYDQPLTEKRLTGWHMSITPVKRRHPAPLVHYQAPETHSAPAKLKAFLDWFNTNDDIDPVIKAGVAHWWFMTIRPFDGSNGRIARAIADLQLTRADSGGYRYYSLSDAIVREPDVYMRFFRSAAGARTVAAPDITSFLEWFLQCLDRSLKSTDAHLSTVLRKAGFWEKHAVFEFNERQRLVLGRLLDGAETRLTSSLWARLTATSSDTAVRDINDLVARGVLEKQAAGGRSTSYVLAEDQV